MSVSNKLASRDTPFSAVPLSRRTIGSRTSFVSVVVYHYDKQNFGTSTNVSQNKFTQEQKYGVTRVVLEEEIRSLKVSKNISSPSGSFDIELHPSQNWKAQIAPGDWCAIYIYDKYRPREGGSNPPDFDSQNLIMLGNVDRIARSLEKDPESDKNKLGYIMSGRNFGKVLEETDIWFDPFSNQEQTLDTALIQAGLEITGNPTTQVTKVLDVFLGKGGQFFGGRTSPLNQWILPYQVTNIFGVASFATGVPQLNDVLRRVITPNMPGYKVRNMLGLSSNGSVWEMLERSSNSLVNELFLEEVRDATGRAYPTLVCRPRPLQTPFFYTKGHYSQYGKQDSAIRPQLNGAYQSLQNLGTTSFFEISPAEIQHENIGRDDHSRLNMFWLNTTQNMEFAFTNTTNLNGAQGIANPTYSRDSMARGGLRKLEQTLEFCQPSNGAQPVQGTAPDALLFKAFMGQIYDMNYANHLYESGTIQCTGVLEAELGKAMVIKADPQLTGSQDKVYYVEGYDHEWTFPNHWTTSFTVTHGQFLGGTNIFIDQTEDDNGAPDVVLDTTYLTKTKTSRG